MQRPVRKVMEHVLKHEEQRDLRSHQLPARERHRVRREAKVFRERVESPDLRVGSAHDRQSRGREGAYLREFNGEMGEQDSLGALPHLGVCRLFLGLKLPLTEVRDSVDDHPGDAAAKVDDLRASASARARAGTVVAEG